MRMDAVAQEAETVICKDLGAPRTALRAIEAAMHIEIGGDKDVDNGNAGKVVLF